MTSLIGQRCTHSDVFSRLILIDQKVDSISKKVSSTKKEVIASRFIPFV